MKNIYFFMLCTLPVYTATFFIIENKANQTIVIDHIAFAAYDGVNQNVSFMQDIPINAHHTLNTLSLTGNKVAPIAYLLLKVNDQVYSYRPSMPNGHGTITVTPENIEVSGDIIQQKEMTPSSKKQERRWGIKRL